MTRIGVGEPVIAVRPRNNIYTVLTGVALVAVIVALVALVMRANTLGIGFFGAQQG